MWDIEKRKIILSRDVKFKETIGTAIKENRKCTFDRIDAKEEEKKDRQENQEINIEEEKNREINLIETDEKNSQKNM